MPPEVTPARLLVTRGRRTRTFGVRLDVRQFVILTATAQSLGISRNALVREAILSACENPAAIMERINRKDPS